MTAKRGQPRRQKFNVRLSPEELEAERNDYPFAPFAELLSDGQGLDYCLPPPPWNRDWREEMENNLARLRVDPKHSNKAADFSLPLTRAIAGLGAEWSFYDVGEFFGKLLERHDAPTAKVYFDEVLRMRQAADEPPHRNFLSYRAYCDFLQEFGFEPSMPRLTEFIKANPQTYPVGINEPAGHKAWWQMFFESGLVRLAE